MKISEETLRKIIQERLKKSLGGSHPDERYMPATDKNLFLDRPTSHGGWPEGPSRSAYDSTPVGKQISNYLKSMGIISEEEED